VLNEHLLEQMWSEEAGVGGEDSDEISIGDGSGGGGGMNEAVANEAVDVDVMDEAVVPTLLPARRARRCPHFGGVVRNMICCTMKGFSPVT
jgi:hypothetical protein